MHVPFIGYTVHMSTKADKTCSVLPLSPMYVNDNTQQRVYGQCLVWYGMSLTRVQQYIFGTLETDFYYEFNCLQTLRQTKPRARPEAAICVRKSSARRVLHFTPLNAASCVLHRPANRVIHRLQLYLTLYYDFHRMNVFKAHSLLNLMGAQSRYYVGIAMKPIIKSSGRVGEHTVTPQPDSLSPVKKRASTHYILRQV